MAGDFTIPADLGSFLDFDKCTDLGIVANLTAVKIHEIINLYILA